MSEEEKEQRNNQKTKTKNNVALLLYNSVFRSFDVRCPPCCRPLPLDRHKKHIGRTIAEVLYEIVIDKIGEENFRAHYHLHCQP